MPKKIEFTESQKRLIDEIKARHNQERSDILNMILEEHGILDDVKKNPQKWAFEQDFSGILKLDEAKKEIPKGK